MRRVWIFLSLLAWAACAAEAGSSSQSAVARNFDALARQLAACADARASCSHEALQMKDLQACQAEYTSCRSRAGSAVETALVDAIAECQERANHCGPSGSEDSAQDPCEASLRACIGETSGQTGGDAKRDANAPNASAPTYQCFGQLRECAGSTTAPKQCAAEARTCVLAAIEKPPPRRPSFVDGRK